MKAIEIIITKRLYKSDIYKNLNSGAKRYFALLIENKIKFEVIKTIKSLNNEDIYILHDGLKMPKKFTKRWIP